MRAFLEPQRWSPLPSSSQPICSSLSLRSHIVKTQLHIVGDMEWLDTQMRVLCPSVLQWRGINNLISPNEMIFCNQVQTNTPKLQLLGLHDSHLQHTHKFSQWKPVGMAAKQCFGYYIGSFPHKIISHAKSLFPLTTASVSVWKSLNKRGCHQGSIHHSWHLLMSIQFDTCHPLSCIIRLEIWSHTLMRWLSLIIPVFENTKSGGLPWVQDQLGVHSEFYVILGHSVRPSLKTSPHSPPPQSPYVSISRHKE